MEKKNYFRNRVEFSARFFSICPPSDRGRLSLYALPLGANVNENHKEADTERMGPPGPGALLKILRNVVFMDGKFTVSIP